MKKIVMLIAMAAFVGLYSCTEDEEKCEDCKAVTVDDAGEKVDEDAAEEYCGSSLSNIENTDTVEVGDNKTYYDCQ